MHKFDPKKIEMLLSEDRKKEIDPEKYLKEKGLKDGMVFADIGCGPGFFVFPASEMVGKNGKVYAVDTQQEMLDEIKKRKPAKNVIVLKSEETKLPVNSGVIDIVLMVFMLHEVYKPKEFLREVRRVLKPSGRFIVIDWEKRVEDNGPPFKERLPREKATELFNMTGFKKIELSSLNTSHYEITGCRE